LDGAFDKLTRLHADALMVHIDSLFQAHDKKIVPLAARIMNQSSMLNLTI
jgi:hypothetical protein